jgi:hypothetical protein
LACTLHELESARSDGLLKVVGESGTFFGTVKSVEIDRDAGQVQRVSATRGGVLGVRADVRTFGADAIRHAGSEILTVAETGKRTRPRDDALVGFS